MKNSVAFARELNALSAKRKNIRQLHDAERCTFNQTKGPVGSVCFFQKGGVLFVVNKEMLTRQLLALDGIEPDGDTEIRKIRKESIHSVNMCLSLLDSKVRDMTTDHDGSSDRMDLAELTELNTEMLNSSRVPGSCSGLSPP